MEGQFNRYKYSIFARYLNKKEEKDKIPIIFCELDKEGKQLRDPTTGKLIPTKIDGFGFPSPCIIAYDGTILDNAEVEIILEENKWLNEEEIIKQINGENKKINFKIQGTLASHYWLKKK